MTKAEIKAFILPLIAELTDTKCIWDKQNAPKPANPYIALNLSPERDVGNEIRRRKDGTGVLDVIGRRESTLSVNGYGNGSIGKINALWLALNRPTIVDRCLAKRVAFIRAETPLDLTELIDGRSWEERANLDLIVGYSIATTDDPGYITTVDVPGEFSEPVIEPPATEEAIVKVEISMKGVL